MRIVAFLGMSLALAFVAVGIVGPAALEVGEARPSQRQSFGGGSAAVVAPPGSDVTDVAWVLDSGDPSRVDKVFVKFDSVPLPAGAQVNVQVRDGDGPIVGSQGSSTSGTLDCGLGGFSGDLDVGETCEVDLGTNASAAAITGIDITVIQPIVGVYTGPEGIEVTEVDWTLRTTDFSKVDHVTVTLSGVPTGEALKVHMTLKDDADNELQRVTGLPTDPPTAPGSGIVFVTWDLTEPPNTPESAALITGFQIQVTPD